MKLLNMSAAVALLSSFLPKKLARPTRDGPGVRNHFKGLRGKKYLGRDVRRLQTERGCGRPVRSDADRIKAVRP